MIFRAVNTTTRLPADEAIESVLLEAMDPLFLSSLERGQRGTRQIAIFFVDSIDLDKDIQNEELTENSIDRLGIYKSHDPVFHRPIIKVSPEKVLLCCKAFLKDKKPLPRLEEFYPVLLAAVIIHELGHWLMDRHDETSLLDTPWRWAASALQDDGAQAEKVTWHGPCLRCKVGGGAPSKEARYIEESLANAIVLKQRFEHKHMKFLRSFIESQPEGYKRGIQWSGSLRDTLDTAEAWRNDDQCKFDLSSFWKRFSSGAGLDRSDFTASAVQVQ